MKYVKKTLLTNCAVQFIFYSAITDQLAARHHFALLHILSVRNPVQMFMLQYLGAPHA